MRGVELRRTMGGRPMHVFTDADGREWSTRELSSELGLTPEGLLLRLRSLGVESDAFWARAGDAKTAPPRWGSEYSHLGLTGGVRFWSERLGISKEAFWKRLQKRGPHDPRVFEPRGDRGRRSA